MTTLATLLVAFGVDAKGLQDDLNKTEGMVSKTAGGLGSLLNGAATVGLAATAAGAALAIGGLAAGLKLSIDEAMGAQVVEAQLAAVLQSTGGVAGVTAQSAMDLAGSLSEVTRYADDTILSAENVMLTFTSVSSSVFPDAIQTALDMSTALGTDLQGSVIQLGKALQDPIQGVGALQRVGVNFSDEQKNMIKALVESNDTLGAQKLILAELQKEFGGSAVAAGQTFGGQLDILRNQLLNVAEGIGMQLLPVAEQLLKTLTPLITDLAKKFTDFVASDQFQAWLKEAIRWLKDDLPVALAKAADYWTSTLYPAIKQAGPVLLEIGKFVADYVIPALAKLASFLGVVLPPLFALFAAGWKAQIEIIEYFLKPFRMAIDGFGILWDRIMKVKDALQSLKLPDWLTPGSPTPLEIGLVGINRQLNLLPDGMGVAYSLPAGMSNSMPAISQVKPAQPVFVNVNYAPMISTANELEATEALRPMFQRLARE